MVPAARKYSDVGSAIICNTIVESAKRFSERGRQASTSSSAKTCFAGARRPARGSSRRRASATAKCGELASTLCAAIVAPERSCFFQIGDGAMILRRNGVYGVVFWPQTGEYANSTNFLTSHQYDSQLEFISIETALFRTSR